MAITAEVSYAIGDHSGRLVTITAEVSYVAGGHSGGLVTITAEVSYTTGGHSRKNIVKAAPRWCFKDVYK